MKKFDAIIIGGSYAGLSAGMALGRSLRSVLIIDAGQPCNRYAPHSHNFITHDGESPAAIAQKAKEQVLKYPTITWLDGKAIDAAKIDEGFVIVTEAGESFSASKLLFATGVIDELPDTPGFAECWGKTIVHCPYCHGYELRGLETGVLLSNDIAAQMGQLIANWTDKLTIFTNGPSKIDSKDKVKLDEKGIKVIDKLVTGFIQQEGKLSAIQLDDKEEWPLQVVYSHPLRIQHTNLPEKLGCKLTEHDLLEVNGFQQTTVPGIYAAGDNCTIFRAVSAAVANGTMAGAMINKELVGL